MKKAASKQTMRIINLVGRGSSWAGRKTLMTRRRLQFEENQLRERKKREFPEWGRLRSKKGLSSFVAVAPDFFTCFLKISEYEMRTGGCEGCTVVIVTDAHSLRCAVSLFERSKTHVIHARGLYGSAEVLYTEANPQVWPLSARRFEYLP
jgi:hypothetical protein